MDDCGDGSDEANCLRPTNITFNSNNCPFGLCSQTCVVKKLHSEHHYMCQCSDGYSRAKVMDQTTDNQASEHSIQHSTCEANGQQAKLLVSSDTGFRIVNPYKNSVQELHHLYRFKTNSKRLNRLFVGHIESFDVFYDTNVSHIFWTDSHAKSLYRVDITHIVLLSSLEGDSQHDFSTLLEPKLTDPIEIVANIEKCRGVSVDWLSKYVYWIDASIPSIMMATFDGKRRKTIMSSHPLEQPYDLIVDPKNCFLFWTDWSYSSIKIGRANLDGSSARTLVKNDVVWPLGIALDFEANRLYWCDPKTSIIETIRIDGTDRRRVYALHRSQYKPYRLDVWEDNLFVSTFPNHQVIRLDKFGNNRVLTLVQGIVKLADLVIIHEYKQKSNLTNPCNQNKNPCQPSFLCLSSTPQSSICVCPDGYKKVLTVKNDVECVPTPSPSPSFDSVQPKINDQCPCQNGGRCRYSYDDSLFCECTPLYDGHLCERFRCSGHCKNHGLCYVDLSNVTSIYPNRSSPTNNTKLVNSQGKLRCMCLFGWTGDQCEIPVSSCADERQNHDSHCFNNGTCVKNINGKTGIKCKCLDKFHGDQCEFCEKIFCKNGGHCSIDEHGNWKCNCLQGKTLFL